MEEEPILPEIASRNEVIPQFRMRIIHYFLLSTVYSILCTTKLSWIDWSEIPHENIGVIKLYAGLTSLFYSAAFTALLILLGRRFRYGRSELQSPGHWLLAFFATGAFIEGLTAVLLQFYRFYYDSSRILFEVWNLEKLLLCSTVGITCLVFAWLISGNLWWKSILILSGIVMLALVPQHILVLLGTWKTWLIIAHVYASLGVSAGIVPLLFLACLSDSRRQIQQDWLHWAGVFVTAIAALSEFFFALYWLWNW